MTSPSPLLYNTYYHIYNRGNNRETIFLQERNYKYFMDLYARHVHPVVETFAFCLLRNHFHLMVRTKSEMEIRKVLRIPPDGPLGSDYVSQQFSNFFNAYTKSINKAYGRTGGLFQHPFGRVPITTDRQFWNVISYIHQNPQKHGLVRDFRDWKWSSYQILLEDKPTRLQRAAVMEWFGSREEYLELHQQWVSEAQAKWLALDDD